MRPEIKERIVKTNLKKTELGKLPAEWETASLDEVGIIAGEGFNGVSTDGEGQTAGVF